MTLINVNKTTNKVTIDGDVEVTGSINGNVSGGIGGISDTDFVEVFRNVYDNGEDSTTEEKLPWELSYDELKEDISQLKLAFRDRTFGQVIHSLLPIKDKTYHLADGDVLYDGGIYSGFYSYVSELQEEYPDMFIDEAGWQTCVTTYGSCGKFVLTDTYVRLPKISNIIQGTTDIDALGDLVEAGLPNITGTFGEFSADTLWGLQTYNTGPFERVANSVTVSNVTTTTAKAGYNFTFDASKSNSIYSDDVDTVQPQTIKTLIYICVIAGYEDEVKTTAQQIFTEIDRKADKSLLNTSYAFYKFPTNDKINLSTQGQELSHSLTITTKKGNPVFVSVTGDSNSTNALAWINIYLMRGDTTLAHQICVSESSSTNNPFGLTILDDVPIGTYTYTVKFTLGSSNGTYLNETSSVQSPNFLVYEI